MRCNIVRLTLTVTAPIDKYLISGPQPLAFILHEPEQSGSVLISDALQSSSDL